LHSELPETSGLDGTDHLRAALHYGARVDAFVYQEAGALTVDDALVKDLGVEPVAAEVTRSPHAGHDPALLARVLNTLT